MPADRPGFAPVTPPGGTAMLESGSYCAGSHAPISAGRKRLSWSFRPRGAGPRNKEAPAQSKVHLHLSPQTGLSHQMDHRLSLLQKAMKLRKEVEQLNLRSLRGRSRRWRIRSTTGRRPRRRKGTQERAKGGKQRGQRGAARGEGASSVVLCQPLLQARVLRRAGPEVFAIGRAAWTLDRPYEKCQYFLALRRSETLST